MSELTTSKTLNLRQLGTEIGGNPWFRYSGTRLESSAAQAALEAGVAAHVANPAIVAPPSAEETNAATLRQQALTALAANRTHVALAAPTTAQNTAQIKALSRQMNGVIRLLLGQLDGTD